MCWRSHGGRRSVYAAANRPPAFAREHKQSRWFRFVFCHVVTTSTILGTSVGGLGHHVAFPALARARAAAAGWAGRGPARGGGTGRARCSAAPPPAEAGQPCRALTLRRVTPPSAAPCRQKRGCMHGTHRVPTRPPAYLLQLSAPSALPPGRALTPPAPPARTRCGRANIPHHQAAASSSLLRAASVVRGSGF